MIIILFLLLIIGCEAKPSIVNDDTVDHKNTSLSENTISQIGDIDTITHECFKAIIPINLNVSLPTIAEGKKSETVERKSIQLQSREDEYMFCVRCDDDSENSNIQPEQIDVEIDIDPTTGEIDLTIKDFKLE